VGSNPAGRASFKKFLGAIGDSRVCYPSIVKLFGKVVLAIFALAAAVIAFAFVRASSARDADRAYHAAIPNTIFLHSISFNPGADIPASYTCKGEGVSPEVSWEGPPAGARSYVLIASDWDSPLRRFRLGNVTHWVLYNIPQGVHGVKSAVKSAELTQEKIDIGINSSGAAAYMPPCPPLGKHRYMFRVYALDVPQIVPASRDREGVMNAMKGRVLAYGEIVGLFGG
jgi:Raf kinase inhibitor-like YbhB/YbcL family protein